jgi:hypothetical protein
MLYKKHINFLVLLLASLLFASASTARAARVEGIVLVPEGPLQDAVVYAYPDFSSLESNTGGHVSLPGEKAGQFRLDLAPGTYFFVAHGMLNGKKMFAYHGLNPILITDDFHWMPFFAVQSHKPLCRNGPQGIGGTVRYKGKPVTGGMVSVYNPEDVNFRGMGLLSNTLDDEGRFWFDLEQGSYVVIARKRLGESNMGPLKKGDFFCYAEPNPIQVIPSTSCDITISCYPRDDLDTFLENSEQDPRGRKEETRRTASLWETEFEDASKIRQQMLQRPVEVNGIVRDTSGNPVPELYVSAYEAETFPLFQMFVIRMMTDYMAKTDDSGSYHLKLEKGKTYYLVAREKIGEAPDHLEFYGLYEGNANHSITVAPGIDTSEIDIVVERIMP